MATTRNATAAPAITPVMQRDHEHERVVVDGRRTDDGTRCTLVVVREVSGTWALYPHGAGQLGVRLPAEQAARVARAIASATG